MADCAMAALEYLRLGLHPIPCAPRTKRPLVEWRTFQETAPTVDEIDEWWSKWPDANVALVLGRGTFAVDLDGGHEAERLLTDRGVYLPGAPRSKTANGYHVFLSAPGPVADRVGLLGAANGKKPQVDIRGVGIVVAPPSIHPTGARYEWYIPLSLPFPTAPQTLLDLMQTSGARAPVLQHASNAAGWVAEALSGVGEGLRDATCTKLAGYFLGRGLDAATVETVLIHSFARACSPPFSDADVRKCVQSIARKHGVTGTEDRNLTPVHVSAALRTVEAEMGQKSRPVVRTPFPSLNMWLNGGFSPGELVYVGARPGVGKTAWGLGVARMGAKDGIGSLFVSREMVNAALARRMLAQEAKVPAGGLRTGRMEPEERAEVGPASQRLARLPIWMTDEAVSLTEIADMVAGWREDTPLGLLLVDYLQLVRAPRDIRERRLQVEAVSQGLKTLALQFKIPVICLSSLSRPIEGKDRRPTLASLRESGELEHDADVVLLLHREPMSPETECIVAKNREGQMGTAHLNFRADYVSFDEVAR